jgi:hypothetical protein
MGRTCSTNGAERNACRIFVGKPEGKPSIRRKHLCGWMILKWMLKRWNELDSSDSGYGPVDEHSGSKKML